MSITVTVSLPPASGETLPGCTRAVQPALWMLIFGQTFSQVRAIPTGGVSYPAFLAPGIDAPSALFISILYRIQIIWDRDAGVLNKLMVTPSPRSALIAGKSFAAGIRAVSQVVVVVIVAHRRTGWPTLLDSLRERRPSVG